MTGERAKTVRAALPATPRSGVFEDQPVRASVQFSLTVGEIERPIGARSRLAIDAATGGDIARYKLNESRTSVKGGGNDALAIAIARSEGETRRAAVGVRAAFVWCLLASIWHFADKIGPATLRADVALLQPVLSDTTSQPATGPLRPIEPLLPAGSLLEPKAPAPAVSSPSQLPSIEAKPIRPGVLAPPDDMLSGEESPVVEFPMDRFFYPIDAPLGFSGPTGILPGEGADGSDFVPIRDRWRMGMPAWDRYGRGHPLIEDYPFTEGVWYDPYNQNVLKGDYPILGQHTFLNITATSQAILEGRQLPTPTTPFESTSTPGQEEFFGDPDQFFYTHFFRLSVDLNHGIGAFKPTDWRIKATPVFNLNYLEVNELGIVSPDVRNGETRFREDFALDEWFFESKIADLSPDYDFVSVRAGSQPFVSDFRGFILSDVNRAVRLFGTRGANRDQFNVVWFDQTEKETNSQLNTFEDRHQNTVVANYFRQDFIWPGYTALVNFHYNRDQPDFLFDKNGFLVRPDPVGVFKPHEVNAYYFGWAGEGHINRINVSHALYYVFGHDTLNPLEGQPLDISAWMAAAELSYDRDWIRFRTSYFFSSGDDDITDGRGTGFDSILDNPNFAGGEFSFWQRQQIGLFGVNLVQRNSLVPDLRSSKFQGQSNFVNPGLHLLNLGMDFEITPRTRLISNCNFLWFDQTEVLEQFAFQDPVRSFIGTDLSLGVEYRPWLNNNGIILAGISGLLPATGFEDLYNPSGGEVNDLFAAFTEIILTY
jgi:hypothetical protein